MEESSIGCRYSCAKSLSWLVLKVTYSPSSHGNDDNQVYSGCLLLCDHNIQIRGYSSKDILVLKCCIPSGRWGNLSRQRKPWHIMMDISVNLPCVKSYTSVVNKEGTGDIVKSYIALY